MTSGSRIMAALDALNDLDRRKAAALIGEELRLGEPHGKRWQSVYKLADKIGEIDMALDASLRVATTPPMTLTSIITHCGALTKVGRSEDAIALINRLPPQALEHPAALHFLSMIDSENGDFAAATDKLNRALALSPLSSDSWFALAMIKTFTSDDKDFQRMSSIESQVEKYDPIALARYYYAMGKAVIDTGDIERGFDYYAKGAALRKAEDPYDRAQQEASAEALIRDFTRENLAKLEPSKFEGQRAIFVNGLPRSGTTLVESLLISHSKVVDGAELNLVKTALLPVTNYSFEGALAYQAKFAGQDPWGRVAEDYHHMLAMRFREPGLVVDKTLGQSALMGLLLHAMPDAKVIWMRRRPEDSALSSYRTLFTSTVRWSWTLEDIAHQMRIEDRLFEHWTTLFPDRILPVQYEELVRDPDLWIPKILDHVGLDNEAQVRNFHENKRKVRTASVKQVRSPIHTSAIGKSERFAAQLKPFMDAYYG